MLLNQRVFLTAIFLFASACSSDDNPQGVIPEAQLQAMEKARAVEDALEKQHEELRKKLEAE
jgi:hypothetical protein